MNGFFGIGIWEMMVIGVLALIFIGPERLPEVVRQVMTTIRELRNYASQVRDELQGEFGEVRRELDEVTREVDAFTRDVTADVDAVASETQQVVNDTNTAVSELTAPPPPRELAPLIPSATAARHATNGVSHDDDDDQPKLTDYRPS